MKIKNSNKNSRFSGITIRIGGVSLLLKGKLLQDKEFNDPCYRKFFSRESSKPLLIFNRSNNNLPDKIYRNHFDSPGLWSINFNNHWDFCIELRDSNRKPLALIEVSVKDGEGFIYTNSKESGKNGTREWEIPEFFAQRLSSLPFSYPVDEVIFMNILPLFRGILLHACGINDNGNGYIFSGFSGAGKSTMAKQWLGVRGVRLLNDDRVIIRETRGNFYVHGTPWHGELRDCDPGKARLKAVFFIRHGRENNIRPLSLSEAVTGMIARSFSPLWDREGMQKVIEVVERIVRKIPCYELSFRPDQTVINYIRSLEI